MDSMKLLFIRLEKDKEVIVLLSGHMDIMIFPTMQVIVCGEQEDVVGGVDK